MPPPFPKDQVSMSQAQQKLCHIVDHHDNMAWTESFLEAIHLFHRGWMVHKMWL